MINRIKELIVKNGETISVAESVTSGNLQVALSQAMDASQYFQGGITVYNVGQKARQLNIDPIHALNVNSVSNKVAEQLALEVCKKFLSDYGIGITGYATIVPECEEEGLFAHVAIVYNQSVIISKRLRSTKEGNLNVQLDYTKQALEILLMWLEANHENGGSIEYKKAETL